MQGKEQSNDIDIYRGIKEGEAMLAIIVWVLYGIFTLFIGTMHGIVTLILYFIVGILLASFAAIPTYLLQRFIAKGLMKLKASYDATVLTSYGLTAIKILWVYLIARFWLSLINNI